jgi:hypothetical protein
LIVVEGDAAVRHCWERGKLAVTRDGLYARLLSALAPLVSLADPAVVRLALSDVLAELGAAEAWLGVLAARGGRAWIDLVSAVFVSLGEARRHLWFGPQVGDPGVLEDPRARILFAAGRRLDEALERLGQVDPANTAEIVASALGRASADEIVLALDAKDGTAPPERGQHLNVVATGIASWLPADLALWRALDARLSLAGGSAKIELVTFDRPLDAARAPEPLGRLIDAVAEATDDAPQTRPIAAVLGDFTFGILADASRARVEVRQADDLAAEARAILSAVQEALGAGASVEEIAIALPQGAAKSNASIARALAEAGIAVSGTATTTETEGGLIACAREAMIVADEDVPRLGLAALLRSPYLDGARITGLPSEDEARAALARLSHILEVTPSAAGGPPCDSIAATVLSFERKEHEPIAQLALLSRRITDLFTRARGGTCRSEHIANARRLFQDLGLAARPGPALKAQFAEDPPPQGVGRAELEAFARDARGAKRLYATLDAYERAAASVASGAPQSFASFRLELEGELAVMDRAGEPPSAGTVRVGTLSDLEVRPRALLVYADAHEGSLDPLSEGIALFGGSLMARLNEGVEPAFRASIVAARGADRVRLAALADMAAHVVIAYTTRDDEGGLLPPHPFVAWLEREGAPQTVWRDGIRVDRPLTVREERLKKLGAARSERASLAPLATPLAAQRAAVEMRREGEFGLPSRSRGGVASWIASERVRAIVREETGGGEKAMAVTSLDRFGACLFQGFAAEVLRAKKKRVVYDVIDAREEGILLHGALAAAFGATRGLWARRPRDADRIRGSSRDAARDFLGLRGTAPALRRAALEDISRQVSKVVDWSLADEEWDFFQAESRFGMDTSPWSEANAAVVLDDGQTTLSLRGSIDRVDVAHGHPRLRVIDYKRGEESARRLTNDLGESSFQLAVYARAASLGLDLPSAAGSYLPTRRLSVSYRTRGSETAWEKAHELEEGLPRYARRALALVERVRHGDVEPRPARPETCEVCDFDGVCRKPRFIIVASAPEGQDEVRDGG